MLYSELYTRFQALQLASTFSVDSSIGCEQILEVDGSRSLLVISAVTLVTGLFRTQRILVLTLFKDLKR